MLAPAPPESAGMSRAALDRLELNEKRVKAMADGIDVVRGLSGLFKKK